MSVEFPPVTEKDGSRCLLSHDVTSAESLLSSRGLELGTRWGECPRDQPQENPGAECVISFLGDSTAHVVTVQWWRS